MVVRRVSEACIVYTLLVRLYELKGPSAQNPYSIRDQLDRVLTLEVGKSPTEVTCGRHVPRSPPSAIIEFASSPSCSWSLNRAVLDDARRAPTW